MEATQRNGQGPEEPGRHPAGSPGNHPVLVGVDGSPAATAAVRWAAEEAARREVPLRIVHGYAWPDRPHLGDPGLGVDPERVLREQAQEWLAEAERVARETGPDGLAVTTDLQIGHAVELLVRDSADAGLVVLGSRGLGGFSELLAGSVAVTVAARAVCPVVVVRGEARANGPVVVGVDGSALSEAALAHAYAAADAYRVPLVVVHSRDHHTLDTLPDWVPVSGWERELLAPLLTRWAEKYPEVEVRQVNATGRPAAALLRAANRARLLVVGARGRGGFLGLLLGSTSQAVLHHAPCPVLVVRPGTDR